MKSKMIFFEECGKSEMREYAKSVLSGEAKIYAIIEQKAFALPTDIEEFDYLDDNSYDMVEDRYMSGTWRKIFAPVRSGKWGPWGCVTNKYDHRDHIYEEDEAQLLDYALLQRWIKKNKLDVELGAYELCRKSTLRIATELLTKPKPSLSGAYFTDARLMRIYRKGEFVPVAYIGDLIDDGDRLLVWAELFEFSKCAFLVTWTSEEIEAFEKRLSVDGGSVSSHKTKNPQQSALDPQIPGRAEVQISQPKGGDRLTEKLYDFSNEIGVENVNAKGFLDWLRENYTDFDVSHDIISYRQKNGEFAEVNNYQLKARIFRLRHPNKAR